MINKKWSDLYQTEQDLINDMLKTKSNPNEVAYVHLVKGYGYIEGFKRYYEKHGCLTDKQMTQLKRLATEVYKNVNWGKQG